MSYEILEKIKEQNFNQVEKEMNKAMGSKILNQINSMKSDVANNLFNRQSGE